MPQLNITVNWWCTAKYAYSIMRASSSLLTQDPLSIQEPELIIILRSRCEMQAKGVGDAGSAAFRVSGMELGGLFGSLLAGRISDALIAKNPKGGNVGKRVQASPPLFAG